MKKIIILAYFFPPANQVGGVRPFAWAKYLHKFGFYPIVVTRNWNDNQTDIVERVIKNQFKHEKHEGYEVYRLPHNYTLRDRLSNFPKLKLIQKGLSFIELITSNFFLHSIPYYNIYNFAQNLIANDSSIKAVISTGRPFQLFKFGSLLKKEFNIKFIADYRDEWNTFQNRTPKNILEKLVFGLEKSSELKWTQNADCFITVSEYWAQRIEGFIHKKGFVVMNGFDDNNMQKITLNRNPQKSVINLTYAGTLYPNQKIEKIISVIIKLNQEFKIPAKIKFIGIETIPSELHKINTLTSLHTNYFEIIPRISQNELQKVFEETDFNILTGFDGIKGWFPVKLFDNFLYKIPIILFPTDNDVIEKTIKETKSGLTFNSENETIDFLKNYYLHKDLSAYNIIFDESRIPFYSRINQTKILSNILYQTGL